MYSGIPYPFTLKEKHKQDRLAYVEAALFSVGDFAYINIDTAAP
jgi:hypothetical protein